MDYLDGKFSARVVLSPSFNNSFKVFIFKKTNYLQLYLIYMCDLRHPYSSVFYYDHLARDSCVKCFNEKNYSVAHLNKMVVKYKLIYYKVACK